MLTVYFLFVAQSRPPPPKLPVLPVCEGVDHSGDVRTRLTSAAPMSSWEEDLVETLFRISSFFWF